MRLGFSIFVELRFLPPDLIYGAIGEGSRWDSRVRPAAASGNLEIKMGGKCKSAVLKICIPSSSLNNNHI